MQHRRVVAAFVVLMLGAVVTVTLKGTLVSRLEVGGSYVGAGAVPAEPNSARRTGVTAPSTGLPDPDSDGEDIPADALVAYQRAAEILAEVKPECGLGWTLLAAIGRVESDHGRTAVVPTDERSAGPLQLRPTTWNVVGVDGDGDGNRSVLDIDDAALAVAVYLCSGVEGLRDSDGVRAALLRYNASESYATLVLQYDTLYRDGDFGIWGDSGLLPTGGELPGSHTAGTPLTASALALAQAGPRLSAQALALVRTAAKEAMRKAAARGGAATEVEPAIVPTANPSRDEARAFAAGRPVGKSPQSQTAERPRTRRPPGEKAAESDRRQRPSPSPTKPSPTAGPAAEPAPAGPATSSPAPTDSERSEPASPLPSALVPSELPSMEVPDAQLLGSEPASPKPEPSAPVPSTTAPSKPTPTEPTSSPSCDPAPGVLELPTTDQPVTCADGVVTAPGDITAPTP
jgi:hypothetical protein